MTFRLQLQWMKLQVPLLCGSHAWYLSPTRRHLMHEKSQLLRTFSPEHKRQRTLDHNDTQLLSQPSPTILAKRNKRSIRDMTTTSKELPELHIPQMRTLFTSTATETEPSTNIHSPCAVLQSSTESALLAGTHSTTTFVDSRVGVCFSTRSF